MQRFLLQISVAACALLPIHSNAETWEIEGLEPPAKLAKAERAFLDVRNAKRDLADIPQNASDTIGSVEDEIFQIQKSISNAIAEYNTRERGMEAEIERDNVLRERAVEEARIERERLDKEHNRLTGVYQRAHENKDNLSLEDISKLRAEIEPELAKNEELRIKNRDERDNVLRALERRATGRENELLDLAARIPDQSDLMRPEDRLRRVKTIKLDAEQKLEKLRTEEHDTAISFLRELYATAPEHLVAVTASQNKKSFYIAEWKPTGEASATTQAEKDAIASVIAEEEAKHRILENSTKTWRRVVREHAQSIKLESVSATEALNLIADEQYRTVWINASLEMTGTVVGAIGTGGISSVIQLASQTGKAFAKVKKRTKLLGSVTGKADKIIIESVSAAIGKLVNGKAVGALSAANEIYDFEFGIGSEDREFNVNRETGFKSDAGQLIAGDVAEFVVSTTAEEISKGVARNMGILTKATKAAASVSDLTKGAGVDLATTGLKAIVSSRAQALNNARAKQYMTSHIVAEALHASFLKAKRVWLRLDAVTKAHREMVEALKLRLENGPRALEMEKESKLTELSEGDTFDMVFEFSNPVITEPVISAEGLSFLTLEPVTSERRNWKAKVLVERDGLDDVQLDVGYKDSERPWQLLDSNPATQPKLISLFKDYWDGYEAGNDTNHVLRLGEEEEEDDPFADALCDDPVEVVLPGAELQLGYECSVSDEPNTPIATTDDGSFAPKSNSDNLQPPSSGVVGSRRIVTDFCGNESLQGLGVEPEAQEIDCIEICKPGEECKWVNLSGPVKKLSQEQRNSVGDYHVILPAVEEITVEKVPLDIESDLGLQKELIDVLSGIENLQSPNGILPDLRGITDPKFDNETIIPNASQDRQFSDPVSID